MSQLNIDTIKQVFMGLKDCTIQSFEQPIGDGKIIMEKNGRKKNVNFQQLFNVAGLATMPAYRAITSLPITVKKSKKKTLADVDDLTDTGAKVNEIEVVEAGTPSTNIFNMNDIVDKQVIAIRFYNPTATNARLTICMDFLPKDIAEDPILRKKTRPVLMVLTFNIPTDDASKKIEISL